MITGPLTGIECPPGPLAGQELYSVHSFHRVRCPSEAGTVSAQQQPGLEFVFCFRHLSASGF